MNNITTEEAIEILKNVIQKYKESYQFQNVINTDIIALEKVLNELEKKDKIIDAMVEQLVGLTIWNNRKDEPLMLMTEEDVKHFFEEEVKDE